MNKTLKQDRRQETELRKQFDKAFTDLSDILPFYKANKHLKVITGYLKAYNLLNGHDSAKGRLIIKLGVIG